MVAGHLEEVQPQEINSLVQMEVDPWASGTKDHWMRLRPTRITGRYVRESGWRADRAT